MMLPSPMTMSAIPFRFLQTNEPDSIVIDGVVLRPESAASTLRHACRSCGVAQSGSRSVLFKRLKNFVERKRVSDSLARPERQGNTSHPSLRQKSVNADFNLCCTSAGPKEPGMESKRTAIMQSIFTPCKRLRGCTNVFGCFWRENHNSMYKHEIPCGGNKSFQFLQNRYGGRPLQLPFAVHPGRWNGGGCESGTRKLGGSPRWPQTCAAVPHASASNNQNKNP